VSYTPRTFGLVQAARVEASVKVLFEPFWIDTSMLVKRYCSPIIGRNGRKSMRHAASLILSAPNKVREDGIGLCRGSWSRITKRLLAAPVAASTLRRDVGVLV
jgi:hypothetical protein